VQRRLEGIRVLVTRPRERVEALCFLLEDEGAEVLSIPLLELKPPDDPRPLAAAAEAVHRYRWIVFASPSAVDAFADALREAGTQERIARVAIAAVGPRTARAIEAHGWSVAAEPEEGTGAALFERMRERLEPGDEVLLPAAERGRRELEEALLEEGVRVSRVTAYRAEAAGLAPESLVQLDATPPEVGLFASPRTAEAFLEAAGRERLARMRRVAIGPTTAAALAGLELPATAVAVRPTPEALVEAAVLALQS
jgi:uroporphyrinogen-III synthase